MASQQLRGDRSHDSDNGNRKAFVYARTGLDDSVPTAELQLAAAAAHAKLNGFDHVEEIIDDEVPGNVPPFARPGLRQALMALSLGKAEALAVSGIDRIAYDVGSVMLLMDCARSDGWQLLVPGTNIDSSSPEGRLAVRILCGLAQLQHDTAAGHTVAGDAAGDMAAGHAVAGATSGDAAAGAAGGLDLSLSAEPPGTNTATGSVPRYVEEPDEPNKSLSYLQVWRMSLAEHTVGRSSVEIAERFNKDNVPLPGGRKNKHLKEWTEQMIQEMVKWPQGVGLLERAKAERAQNRSFAQIARGFNDEGLPACTGKQWSAATLSEMLSR